MEGLQGREERNKLRATVIKAEKGNVISKAEVGFIVTLVERFRQDIERKQRQVAMLQGELGQLMANEKIIIDLVDNMVRAAERDQARQDTLANIKGHRTGAIIEDEDSPDGMMDTSDGVLNEPEAVAPSHSFEAAMSQVEEPLKVEDNAPESAPMSLSGN